MNSLYKLTALGEMGQEPDIFFKDEKLAKRAARLWNVMAAVIDPDAVSIDRYEVTEITEEMIIKDESELMKKFREYLR